MFKEFKDVCLVNFIEKFKTDEDCKDYLAHYKWKDGFRCSKCGHTHFWPKKASPYHRVCKCCRHIEAVTSNTLFHKVEFGNSIFYRKLNSPVELLIGWGIIGGNGPGLAEAFVNQTILYNLIIY
jgi:transcription elongation factor Elf1